MMKPSILIIDDEPTFVKKMRLSFGEYDFTGIDNATKTRALKSNTNFDLILLDLNLDPSTDELDGLSLITYLKSSFPEVPLVVVTADEKTETVVQAMKLGADDFLRKRDFDFLAWEKKFDLLLKNKELASDNKLLLENEAEKYPFIGSSKAIKEIKRTLEELAKNPEITVLITGETGVGKGVAARYIHQHSERKNKPFVHVNLSSIQPTLLESSLFGHKKGAFTGADYNRTGFFRSADKGALFLDEIGDIDFNLQSKILNFLEKKSVQIVGDEKEIQLDLQIIIATNKELKALVKENKFREDLYYRIKNFEIEIPPLRYRKEDIEEILNFYLMKKGLGESSDIFENDAKFLLLEYDFPGNVRELKNIVDYFLLKKKILKKDKIDLDCLPEDVKKTRSININMDTSSDKQENKVSSSRKLNQKRAEVELDEIEEALKKSLGQKSLAAKMLGLNLDQLRYRVLKWAQEEKELFERYHLIKKYYKI